MVQLLTILKDTAYVVTKMGIRLNTSYVYEATKKIIGVSLEPNGPIQYFPDDTISTTVPLYIAFDGAVTLSGLRAVYQSIDSLIDEKLGVIENGSY